MDDDTPKKPETQGTPTTAIAPKAKPAAAAAPTPAPEVPQREPQFLPPSTAHRIRPTGHNMNVFHVIAPADHTLEDAVGPDYLKHQNIEGVQVHSRIYIDHENSEWSLLLYVKDNDKELGRLSCFVDSAIDRREQVLIRDNLLSAKIEQRAGVWVLERDNKVVRGGFKSKDAAEVWKRDKLAGK